MINQTCLIFPSAGEGAEVADEVPADAVASRTAATTPAASAPASNVFRRRGILGMIVMGRCGSLRLWVYGFATPQLSRGSAARWVAIVWTGRDEIGDTPPRSDRLVKTRLRSCVRDGKRASRLEHSKRCQA